MKLTFSFLIVFFFFVNCVSSQDSTAYRYLPLSIGNVWVYQFQYTSTYYGNSSGYQLVKVTSSTVHNSKTYFIINVATVFLQGTNSCGHRVFGNGGQIRVDSISGKVFGWEYCQPDSKEYMIDSLNAKLNDSVNVCYYPGTRIICFDTISRNIFQFTKESVGFGITEVESFANWRYVKDFGINNSAQGNPFYSCNSQLKGCVINNILYGDTGTVIGIHTISTKVPESFSLYQNYPNPFNPTTKITFAISELHLPLKGGDKEGVLLRIYDALGREVTTLINRQLTPGTYQTEWNASNYPSGLYFYTLTSGDITETKKMILIK